MCYLLDVILDTVHSDLSIAGRGGSSGTSMGGRDATLLELRLALIAYSAFVLILAVHYFCDLVLQDIILPSCGLKELVLV